LIINNISDQFYTELAKGVEKAASELEFGDVGSQIEIY